MRAAVSTSMRLSDLSGLQLKSFLLVLLEDATRTRNPPTVEEAKRQWTQLIEHDSRVQSMLVATLAQVPSIAEISVADERLRVIASSNAARTNTPMVDAASLSELAQSGSWGRIRQVYAGSRDYEHRLELGLAEDANPVFTIQVLVSNALLRHAVWPEVRAILIAGFVSLTLFGLLLAYVARRGGRRLTQLSQLIDRILQGEVPADGAEATLDQDFATVESKLNLLGAQYRGAVRDAAALRGNMAALLEGLSEATILLDREGVVILSGGPCKRLLGVEPVVGELLPAPAIVELASTGQSVETREITFGGSRLQVSLDRLPDSETTLVRLRDPESSRRLERQLTASSRLEAINRLTGGVAHEIKNPLNSISARLALLESILEDAPEANEELRVISQEVERLDRVVRTFLDFTHPAEMEQEDVDLNAMIWDLVAWITPEASQRRVAVQANASGAEMIVRGDSGLLKQAFLNLASNAMEAMPDGGRMTFHLERRGAEGHVTVTDTGHGIPAEIRDRIFHLYYTTKKGGSGIGLAMTFRAVELHGGRITVESEQGRGTSFRVVLPLKQESE